LRPQGDLSASRMGRSDQSMDEPAGAARGAAPTVALCPDCGHPWVLHSAAHSPVGRGCKVGEGATEAERCLCPRPLPMLEEETIDEAVERLGNLSGREHRRLVYGSRLRDYVFRVIREHLELLVGDAEVLLDVAAFWGDLEAFGPNPATSALLEEQDAVLDELREAVAAVEKRLDVLRERKPKPGTPDRGGAPAFLERSDGTGAARSG
jgi:hypothetical protein